jgi:uncharacterized membrane protein
MKTPVDQCRATTSTGWWTAPASRCENKAKDEGLCGTHLRQLAKRKTIGLDEPMGWTQIPEDKP